MPAVRVFAGSPLTISFGLACRDHTFGGNAFTLATFSKCLWFRLRAVVFNLRVVFLFSRGREKLLINIFIIAFRFYISYMEPLFVIAKIIGLPGSSAVNNFVREGPVNDVVS